MYMKETINITMKLLKYLIILKTNLEKFLVKIKWFKYSQWIVKMDRSANTLANKPDNSTSTSGTHKVKERTGYTLQHAYIYLHTHIHISACTHTQYIHKRNNKNNMQIIISSDKKTGVHSHVNAVRRDNKGSKVF